MAPVYSLECAADECGTQFDVVQSFKAPLPVCPDCGGSTKRIITSAPSFSLKGGGWASEGYASTELGDRAASQKADRGGKVVSYPGGKSTKGRDGL